MDTCQTLISFWIGAQSWYTLSQTRLMGLPYMPPLTPLAPPQPIGIQYMAAPGSVWDITSIINPSPRHPAATHLFPSFPEDVKTPPSSTPGSKPASIVSASIILPLPINICGNKNHTHTHQKTRTCRASRTSMDDARRVLAVLP